MSNLLERADDLLRLTESPEENEAKLAAFMLAKHLLRYGIEFTTQEERRRMEEELKDLREKLAAKAVVPAQTSARSMYSKYDGTCASCGRPIYRGDLIKWVPPRGHKPGAYHFKCHS